MVTFDWYGTRLALSASRTLAGLAVVFSTVTGVEYAPLAWLSGERIREPIRNRPASAANPHTYVFVLFITFSVSIELLRASHQRAARGWKAPAPPQSNRRRRSPSPPRPTSTPTSPTPPPQSR